MSRNCDKCKKDLKLNKYFDFLLDFPLFTNKHYSHRLELCRTCERKYDKLIKEWLNGS